MTVLGISNTKLKPLSDSYLAQGTILLTGGYALFHPADREAAEKIIETHNKICGSPLMRALE